ncbi:MULTISPECIES: hypothetical protein [Helicobacter]|uniref:Uncharacterized protein n=1 Tax=Helicobacter ibis TaxID=2962633 RepID=A0ABT4VE79_9HELI|nr:MULTISPECIES: hypothetical protein [Helicobacter]MDA3966382.1 hypothetical protein [Helicobacter sp. WB40]MDA3969004.1 hypothetical protein [Helicobacter ibis]
MKNTIIIRLEGSVVSQIGFVALYKYLTDKGYDVKFDTVTNSFRKVNNEATYCYDSLLRFIFPNLVFNYATKEEINEFQQYKIELITKESIYTLKAPLYIVGYGDMMPLILIYRDFLIANFKANNESLMQSISLDSNSCAFYIDDTLNLYHGSYGRKLSTDFIAKSMYVMNSLSSNIKFHFLVHDYGYFSQYIVPFLEKLPFISEFFVTSLEEALYFSMHTGGIISTTPLGALARILSNKCQYAIFRDYNKEIFDNFSNCILINDNGGR